MRLRIRQGSAGTATLLLWAVRRSSAANISLTGRGAGACRMKVHPQSRLALSMPTRRHIAFSPFEAQRPPHKGSVPDVNGSVSMRMCVGKPCAEKNRCVYAWSIPVPHAGGLQVRASCVVQPNFISQYTPLRFCRASPGSRRVSLSGRLFYLVFRAKVARFLPSHARRPKSALRDPGSAR